MSGYCFASDESEIMDSQKEALGISSFIEESNKYSKDFFSDLDVQDLFNSAVTGKIDNQKIFHGIFSFLGQEVVNSITVVGSILVVIVIHSILKSIGENLGNENVSKIIYYVQYIMIVTLIMTNFSDIIRVTRDSINNLIGFMNTLVPLLMTLMLATGNIASTTMLQPIIIFLITFIGNFISGVIMPFLLVGTALGIVSQISDKVQIGKLSKFFNSSIVWMLGIILTIFVGVVSLEGTLTSSVDGITAKTTKAAVSSFIPVVGKILGDAVDSVLGCAGILKNAVGIVGVVIIIGICIGPILKLAVLTMLYTLTAALCQPIADEKIVTLIGNMASTFKVLLAILCSISVMLIIGVTLVINISNSGLMYR